MFSFLQTSKMFQNVIEDFDSNKLEQDKTMKKVLESKSGYKLPKPLKAIMGQSYVGFNLASPRLPEIYLF
jgi:hypothetical protein